MICSTYLVFMSVLTFAVLEVDAAHLTQVGNRVNFNRQIGIYSNPFTQHGSTGSNGLLQNGARDPGGVAVNTRSFRITVQDNNHDAHANNINNNNNNNNNHNSNTNNNINRNININNNINGDQTSSNGHWPSHMFTQSPLSFSINDLIQQHLLTRQVLLFLLRKQLLDINGRYIRDQNARGINFVDPRSIIRPVPSFPTLHPPHDTHHQHSPHSPGSITIESTGTIRLSERQTSTGETQLVIDATSNQTKQSKKAVVPAEDPPEKEKHTG